MDLDLAYHGGSGSGPDIERNRWKIKAMLRVELDINFQEEIIDFPL